MPRKSQVITNFLSGRLLGTGHYLESGKSFDGKCWYKIVKSNNEHPHAPWWDTEIDSTDHNDYNPTACLAGFIIRFSEKNSELYKRGCHIAKEAFDQLLAAERENGMHTLTCYLRLMKYIEEAKDRLVYKRGLVHPPTLEPLLAVENS